MTDSLVVIPSKSHISESGVIGVDQKPDQNDRQGNGRHFDTQAKGFHKTLQPETAKTNAWVAATGDEILTNANTQLTYRKVNAVAEMYVSAG